jgi:hypothetical protein
MTVLLRTLRLTTSRTCRPLSHSINLFQRATSRTKVAMNSTTASYQSSHSQEDGNAGTSPKQMGAIQNLKLNDGNEIPMVG